MLRQSLAMGDVAAPVLKFFDGPPTANGRPGVHHVESRAFKDSVLRYFVMKGYRVPRRAGWDCHGTPVELEIEQRLGFTEKAQIERFGLAGFAERCRAAVLAYLADWERLTSRIGYWVDLDDSYSTMSAEYVQSVWWSLKTMYEAGTLYQARRVVPHCTRCETTVSDHEVAQGRAVVADTGVYFRLPLRTGPLAGVSLLAWTAAPWTVLFSALAVIRADLRYVLARGGRAGAHPVVIAADRVEHALGPDAEVVREVAAEELVGERYQPPFDFAGAEGDAWHHVVADDFVEKDPGTGIVSIAPAYGVDDMRVAQDNGVPAVGGTDQAGRFDQRFGPLAGVGVGEAGEFVLAELRSRGLEVHSEPHSHAVPSCWRCDTRLIYWAKSCWSVRTTKFREHLRTGNAEVDWRPEHVRDGLYGGWLAGSGDWVISRERYWGTPLPLWRCDNCPHVVAVGSLAELGAKAGTDLSALDPHRPYVDDVSFACERCETGTMSRVPEVADAWYDSGSMPFAQYGYPHVEGSEQRFAETFPADFTAEGTDQTRGWWYSLQSVSTVLFGRNSYRRALCLGHIVDRTGRKMSKSLGNEIDPWALIGAHGADALRWLYLVDGDPWSSRRVWEDKVCEVQAAVLGVVWEVYHRLVTAANEHGWTPLTATPPVERPAQDRRLLAGLARTVSEVDGSLAGFDVTGAGRLIADFVSALSGWCAENDRSDHAFFATLHTCVTTLAGLLAPFTPFLADELYETLVRPFAEDPADSIHLTAFPAVDPEWTLPEPR